MQTCVDCQLAGYVSQAVPFSLSSQPRLMLVGEAPGRDEDRQGEVFVGQAGELLNSILNAAELQRGDVDICNVLLCRPPDNNIKHPAAQAALKLCPSRYLFQTILARRPSVVVALGATALAALSGKPVTSVAQARSRGAQQTKLYIMDGEGEEYSFWLVPSFHPASALPHRSPGNRELIIRDIVTALSLTGSTSEDSESEIDYRTLKTVDAVYELADDLLTASEFSFDVEGQSHNPDDARAGPDIFRDKILGISFSWGEGKAAYLPLRTRRLMTSYLVDYWTYGFGEETQSKVLEILKSILQSRVPKVAQNGKFDVEFVYVDYGIKVNNFRFDTRLASAVLDENTPNDLDFQIRTQLPQFENQKKSILKVTKGGKQMASLPLADIAHYCCGDADSTLRLCNIYSSQIQADPNLVWMFDYSMKFQRALMSFELRGAPIDVGALQPMADTLKREIHATELQMIASCGKTINTGSQPEVLEVLLRVLPPEAIKVLEGEDLGDEEEEDSYSTGREQLEAIVDFHPVVASIVNNRALRQLLNTFVLPIQKKIVDGRIHCSYLVNGARTGRPSSRNPNLNNIPRGGGDVSKARDVFGKQIKNLYTAPKGKVLVQFDQSQIEVRCLANEAEDRLLQNACVSSDVHLSTASEVFGFDFDEGRRLFKEKNVEMKDKRNTAKSNTFLTIYGGTAASAAKKFHLDLALVEKFEKGFFRKYAAVKRYIDNIHKEVDDKKVVCSMFGRYRRIPYAGSDNKKIASRAHRQAVNSLIQGMASDIVGLSIIDLVDRIPRRGFRARPVLTVYDSIVFEVPMEELHDLVPVVQEQMTRQPHPKFIVPLRVDVEYGERWGELESYDGSIKADPHLQVGGSPAHYNIERRI